MTADNITESARDGYCGKVEGERGADDVRFTICDLRFLIECLPDAISPI